MASSRNETGITWSSAAYIDVTSGGNATSDVFTFNAEDWDAAIQIDANNQGTAAPGDLLVAYILWSAGNIDGSAGDDYDTVAHAQSLKILDTYAEDPARHTIPIPSAAKAFKLYVVSSAGSNTIRVRAGVITHRPQ